MTEAAEPLLELIGGDESQEALVCPDDSIAISYAELGRAVTGLAGRLLDAGVGRGDRVAVVLPNGPEIVALLFALASLGATMAPLNPAYTEPEYRFFLDDLAPQLVLVGAGATPAARAAAGTIGIVEVLPWESGLPPRLSVAGDVNSPG
ncbi:MAG TPA: AMP-binding protein, partial [Gaiellales bacterium]